VQVSVYVLAVLSIVSMQSKKQLQDVEAVQNEIVGQAHLENYALKLFLFADNEDRAARFGKYVAFHVPTPTKFCLQVCYPCLTAV